MQITANMIQRGAKAGLETTWELAKVVVPTAVVVALFKASGLLESITALFAPYLSWFGLSGDAAVVLFSGYFINHLPPGRGSIMALHPSAGRNHHLRGDAHLSAIAVLGCPSAKKGQPLKLYFLHPLGCSLAVGWLLGVVLS